MSRKQLFLFSCAVLVLSVFTGSFLYASEIRGPATQIRQGKGYISLCVNDYTGDFSLRVKGSDIISVGGSNYVSDVENDLEVKSRSKDVYARLIINPWDRFYYWMKLGSGSFEIDVPSSSVRNRLSSLTNGLLIGVGIRYLLFPDTMVTPAIAIDAGVDYSSFALKKFRQGVSGEVQIIDDRIELTKAELAFIISKRYNNYEPYGGVKVFRTYASLKDLTTAGQVSGLKDTAGVFAGCKVNIYPQESLTVELNAVGETGLAAAWNIEF